MIRQAQILLAILAALAAASCARQQQAYAIGPAAGAPPPGNERGLFSARQSAPAYAQAQYAQQPRYVREAYPSRLQPPSVLQYRASQYTAPPVPQHPAPQYSPNVVSERYVAAPLGYASVSPDQQPYTLDAGDKLRVVVFGQDGISNSYLVDAGGNVSLPLVGAVRARGRTIQQLSQTIAERLKQGYVREPHVSVEVETYRPFFILGEVTNPGQYPYVADITVEKAIAIAGGFAPRAYKTKVQLSRDAPGQQLKGDVPLNYPLRPGDTVLVKERWF